MSIGQSAPLFLIPITSMGTMDENIHLVLAVHWLTNLQYDERQLVQHITIIFPELL